MKRFLHNVAERIRSISEGRRDTIYQLAWDQSGATVSWLTMENETGELSFTWNSVSAVDTFKRDLFTIDCICLAFETPSGWIEANEDMKGWSDFLAVVESSLPGFPDQQKWWNKVMIPAFQMNHARLWTKMSGSLT